MSHYSLFMDSPLNFALAPGLPLSVEFVQFYINYLILSSFSQRAICNSNDFIDVHSFTWSQVVSSF